MRSSHSELKSFMISNPILGVIFNGRAASASGSFYVPYRASNAGPGRPTG